MVINLALAALLPVPKGIGPVVTKELKVAVLSSPGFTLYSPISTCNCGVKVPAFYIKALRLPVTTPRFSDVAAAEPVTQPCRSSVTSQLTACPFKVPLK